MSSSTSSGSILNRLICRSYYKDFVRAGAKLSDFEKQKLKEIDAELAKLQTDFEQNVLKERNASSVVIDKKRNWPAYGRSDEERDECRES